MVNKTVPAETAVNGGKPKTAPAKATGIIASIKAGELHRILSDVKPFAGNDATLPMLTCTHIESDGKRLLAVTTDRFTLGVSKTDIPQDGNSDVLSDVSFMLWPKDVDTVLKISKTAGKDYDWRYVTISRIADDTVEFKFFSGEQVTVKQADVEFPKFTQLIPKTGSEIARAATGLTSSFLAKFAKVQNERNDLMRVFSHDGTPRGNKPLSVLIGDNFVGLIMPQKLSENTEMLEYRRPGWL